MAYSNDGGRTWTKYKDNPALDAITHYNRDPKVLWHEPTRQWIMAITLSGSGWQDGDYRFRLFSSSNLREWTQISQFEMPTGIDCPDMFELPVDGGSENKRWVFWAGDGTHMIGTFDGKDFRREGEIRRPLIDWPHDGANGYAAQTISNVPDSDGRCIQISWLRHGQYPGMAFNQQASIPCELTLRTTRSGIRLFREPIREVETLRDRGRHWEDIYLGARDNPFRGLEGELFELRVALEPDEHVDEIIFAFRDESMRYDPKQRRLHFRGQSIPAGDAGGALKLQILIDRTSLEVFADEGRTSMSFYLAPNPRAAPLAMTVLGGHATISRMDLWRLKSIWARQFSTAGP